MTARRAIGAVAVVAAILVAILVLAGGGAGYAVELELTTANGLRVGSPVRVGGVSAGKITSLELGHDDRPVAEVRLDRAGASVGRGAGASIVTTNLLGSKLVEIDPGEGSLPSGAVIPRSRVATPVDIDEVLNVLDPDTRTRLQILINEAGIAVTGRRVDFNQALAILPRNLAVAEQVLRDVVADNTTLRQTLAASSRFVTRITAERQDLSQVIGDAGQTLDAVAHKREQLRETLARAPGTLRTLQAFLADLGRTTQPLGPAARALTATAPALTSTLEQLPELRQAADPALRKATAVAPLLTRLGDEATPVVRRASPTLSSAARLSRIAAPLSQALDVSIDDTLGLVEGWGRAIQDRDGVGHIFHGKVTLSPDFITSLVKGVIPDPARSRRDRKRRRPAAPQVVAPPRASAGDPGAAPDPVKPLLDGVTTLPEKIKPLLDYLLEP